RIILVDAHQDAVFAQSKDVAGSQSVDAALAQRPGRFIDEYAVAAGVLDDVMAGTEVHPRVMAGEKTVRVGQRPVVVQRTADAATGHPQHDAAAGAELLALGTDDFESQGHGPDGTFADDPEL